MFVAQCCFAACTTYSAVEQPTVRLHEGFVLVQDDQGFGVAGGQVVDQRGQTRGPREYLIAVSLARVINRRPKIGSGECLRDGLFPAVRLDDYATDDERRAAYRDFKANLARLTEAADSLRGRDTDSGA